MQGVPWAPAPITVSQAKPGQHRSLSCCKSPLWGAARHQQYYQATRGTPSPRALPAQWCPEAAAEMEASEQRSRHSSQDANQECWLLLEQPLTAGLSYLHGTVRSQQFLSSRAENPYTQNDMLVTVCCRKPGLLHSYCSLTKQYSSITALHRSPGFGGFIYVSRLSCTTR